MAAKRYTATLAGLAVAVTLVTTQLHSPVWAQAAGNPMVTGQIVRDYARITFYWPERIHMIANASGTRLMVNFDRRVNPDFGEILRSLYPHVIKAELSANQRTIIFTMSQPYNIRSFITDTESGVDILGIDGSATPSAQEVAQALAASTPESRPANRPVLTNPPVPRLRPALPDERTEAAEHATRDVEAPLLPATETPEEASPPSIAEPASATEGSRATAAPVPDVQVTTPPALTEPDATVAAVDTPPVVTPVTPAQDAPSPVAPKAEAPSSVIDSAPVTVADSSGKAKGSTALSKVAKAQPIASISRPVEDFGGIQGPNIEVESAIVERQSQLRFGFIDRVAAAVWQRGRDVHVLFDTPVTFTGLEAVKTNNSSWLTDIRQLAGKDFSLLQLRLNTDVYLHGLKEREGYGWLLRVESHPVRPEQPLHADIHSGVAASVFVPVTQAKPAITLRDPQIGDTLAVVPLYASNAGIHPQRDFADFTLPATTQGIVVAAKNEDLQVQTTEKGVRISTRGGLLVSDHITAAAAANIHDDRDAQFKPTLLAYRDWYDDDMRVFREREAYLMEMITTAPDEESRAKQRLALAQLYFAHDMYNETNAVLNTIRRNNLEFYREKKLAALDGASYLLNYRFPEAALSLSSDTLNETEEGELLRAAIAAVNGIHEPPIPYLHYNNAYIRQYPPALRQRLAILAADQAIQKGDFRTPPQIFATLDEDRLSKEVADYVDFLKAKLAAESGRNHEAERLWKRLAEKDDRQFRARSRYSLILHQLAQGAITPQDAVEQLDALRIVWRGDDLERSLLMVLGQLQVNLGNYWEGMKAWEELLQYYPNSPDAINAYTRLAETFRALFLEDEADKMDPVKALALYNEFQELTPLGATGDRLVQKLVDRMVNIDLLDQAAARLDHQIQYRLHGEEKSRVGARLAVIHLLNREPAKALDALQRSREEGVPASLSLERNRIAAQALLDLGRIEQALTMIEGDYSLEGENVRLEAYWAKEDWAYVVDIIELILRKREDLNAPFTPREGQQLVQLSLAYIFLGEFEQLRYLRDSYAPLMEENPYKDEFLFLTQERIPTNNENFTKVLESIGAMKGFMDGYRDRLKKEGLSAAVGNVANDSTSDTAPANPQ